MNQAVEEAKNLSEARLTAGFDQEGLEQAAREGFANGAFEDTEEEIPAIVEEFFNGEGGEEQRSGNGGDKPTGLKAKLAEKAQPVGGGT